MNSFFFFVFVSFAVLSGTIHLNLVLPTPRYKDMAVSPLAAGCWRGGTVVGRCVCFDVFSVQLVLKDPLTV
jgi:hypothetical protein